ncbi:hypothetical protein LIER_32336 [Lithospermum erythrorhizon]|uniref:Reverse transcriptase domain-containing protein n=1 Tax=Lithospermum erythrorhizon TaxID=34254 RepID=A0AAV3RVC4_LITER
MLREAEERKVLTGVKISAGSPSISHILFADDTLIFCKATEDEGGRFEKRTSSEVRQRVSIVLPIVEVRDQGKYLGLPLHIGRSTKEVFGYIQGRVEAGVKGWKGKFLSQAGKEVMLKSVASAIPNYIMNCFKLPFIEGVNRAMAKYWWASEDKERGIH